VSARSATGVLERVVREVWIVTAAHAGRRVGMAATFLNPASIVPSLPRVVAGISKAHETWKLIEASGAFAAHLLDESQLELVWRFGLQSSRDADKFDGLETKTAATGSPILVDAVAWIDCRVEGRLDTGDRTVYLAEVVDSAVLRETSPLTLQRLLQLAPRDKMELMRTQLVADAELDAAAIAAWRGTR
jgi:flavin reductase (DIM6/NTAB) family NADH-FMN oxidoreductase RutF